MKKSIQISPQKRKEKAKEAQIEECYKQREKEILDYQKRNPFSHKEWHTAWKNGWLRQHGLGLFSFPSPILHYRTLFRKSKEAFFQLWREEAAEKQRIIKRARP